MESKNLNVEEVEITEALITSESYPILWIGENGFNITRYGKLIIVKPSWYQNEEELALIVPTVDFEALDMTFKPERWYIVAGGISPKLVFVHDIIYASRSEEIKKIILSDLDYSIDTKYELAAGIKNKAYGIIYVKSYISDMFQALEIEEDCSVIAKDYPDTFKIFKRNSKLYITRILPKDC